MICWWLAKESLAEKVAVLPTLPDTSRRNKAPSHGKKRTIEFHKEVCYTSSMDDKAPVASPDAGQMQGERPPFNEVSVLFPLLSIYTAG